MLSFSEGSDLYFLCRKMEKTPSMKEKMDGDVIISRLIRHFSFLDNTTEVILLICTLNWGANIYVSRQGRGINRRNENTVNIT